LPSWGSLPTGSFSVARLLKKEGSVPSNWLRKAPTAVVVTLIVTTGFILVSVIGGFIFLTAIGADVTEFRAFSNTLMNAATLALAGVGAVGGVAAASSSQMTETRTNGALGMMVDRSVDRNIGDRQAHERIGDG
jgi:hypothetical protein